MSTFPSDTTAGQRLTAAYFDGKTATSRPVCLSITGLTLRLTGTDFTLDWPLDKVDISERLGKTPRLLSYSNDGHCEVTDHDALDEMLAGASLLHPVLARQGEHDKMLDKMHHSLYWALLTAVLIVLTFVAAYRYLLPWGSEVIAMQLPEDILQQISVSTLDTMDHFMLQPSRLDATRQQQLTTKFAKLKSPPGNRANYHIVFRSSPDMGANAFALPDGTLVMLDELVSLTTDDNEILAVLAHERGHVERRHALRMLLQNSAVGLVLTWYMGDISTILASAPAILMQAQYSRDMESEADGYAERTLKINALSPCLLASLLKKLEASHRTMTTEENNKIMDYLTSHPSTAERSTLLCPSNQP